MTLYDFLSRLEGVKGRGIQYRARCPAHDDQTASLSVSEGNGGRILLKCHAGCDCPTILAAMGLTWKDINPESLNITTTKPIAAYDYTDGAGALLAQKDRWSGKRFSWRRPDGNGGWIKNRSGVSMPLYNLPDVAKAEAVWIVEGEKDCDVLARLGKVATTNPDGAGEVWQPQYTEALRGKAVFIIPDHDEPGRKHAQNVAAALHQVAKSVKVLDLAQVWLDLPEHADVSDFIAWYMKLDADGEKLANDTLNQLAASAPEWKPTQIETVQAAQPIDIMSAQDLMNCIFQEKIHFVQMLVVDGLTFLVAAPKIGKSWLVLLMALCVARGEPFLGRPTVKSRVLYYALEDSKGRLQSRLRAMGTTEIPSSLYFVTEAPLLEGGFEQHLELWLAAEPGPALVIIDTFQKVRGITGSKANLYQSDYATVGSIKRIADKHQAAILLVHHTNKMKLVSDPYDKISGSTGIMGSADSLIMIDRERDADTATVKFTGRDVYGNDFVIRFDACRWELVCNDANAYAAKNDYDAEPLVQIFRKLITENPKGWRGTYSKLQAIGLEFLGYQPFIDGRGCANKLSDGLANELRKRDNLLVEVGVDTTGGKGIRIQQLTPILAFPTRMRIED